MRKTLQILGFITPLVLSIIWPSFIIGLLANWINFLIFLAVWALWILVAQKVFEFAYLDWIVPISLLIGRGLVALIY